MKALFKLVFSLLIIFSNGRALAIGEGEWSYFRVCIVAPEACTVMTIFIPDGSISFHFIEGSRYPGLYRLEGSGVQFDKSSGEYIGSISQEKYNRLLASGMETIVVNPEDLQNEINEAQTQINDSLEECLLSGAACVVAAASSIGTGALGMLAAGIVCTQTVRLCQKLDRENKNHFNRRNEAKKKLQNYALAKSQSLTSTSTGSSESNSQGSTATIPAQGPTQKWICRSASVAIVEDISGESADASIICGWVFE